MVDQFSDSVSERTRHFHVLICVPISHLEARLHSNQHLLKE